MVQSVDFVLVSGTEPMFTDCALVAWGEELVEIDIAEGSPEVAPGVPVLIRPSMQGLRPDALSSTTGDPAQPWRHGTIAGARGRRISISIEHAKARDLRYWPRMIGGIGLAYAIVPRDRWDLAAKRWLAWSEQPPDAAFFEPDPLMDFSAGGFRFDDVERCVADDLMLLKIKVPTSDTTWRATARVVRVSPIPVDQRDEPEEGAPERTHHIAIEFTSVPPGAVEALVAFTERLQDLRDPLAHAGTRR